MSEDTRCRCTSQDFTVRCSNEATKDDGLCDVCREVGGVHRVD